MTEYNGVERSKTELTATERLRAMLDERGIEWHDTKIGRGYITVYVANGITWTVTEHSSGSLTIRGSAGERITEGITPEQAIAATVGSGYGIDFAESFERPPESMVGECVYDEDGDHIGWIINANTEPDEATMLKLHSRMNDVLLDMQDELLAYHPHERENASSKELIDSVIRAHQIIEDAATVGAGTCHMEVHDNLAETEGMGDVWLECDECNWQMPLEPTTPRFKYCPNCRREVMSE